MMRFLQGFLFFPVLGLANLAAEAETLVESCTSRLAQTFVVMQERPLLKEEHATALMWLRLDAAEADAVGDEAGCLDKVVVAETLLGLRSEDDN
ncbi:MAG: hypothetical protein ACI81Q_000821 [Paracoccaceae bacterium]|jgi:hypothetical protein